MWSLLFIGVTCCSLKMSLFKKSAVKGSNSKEKEPVIDVDDLSLKPKRTRSPTRMYEPHKFKLYAAFQAYAKYFRDASLLVERAIDQLSLLDTKIPYGLPTRIGTSFSLTLMRHMRIW